MMAETTAVTTMSFSGGPGHSKKHDIQKISFKIKGIGSMGNKISGDGPHAGDSWAPIAFLSFSPEANTLRSPDRKFSFVLQLLDRPESPPYMTPEEVEALIFTLVN
ncbi:hypothetical protein NC651_031983 [Populus alba x Populus x berolinensis]|nr:hypothetical protein NC651_031983 [Populus alba x Populus x berolinensis]